MESNDRHLAPTPRACQSAPPDSCETLMHLSNFYSVYSTERCNFHCSYCVAMDRKTAEKTAIEQNTQRLTELFNALEHGLVSVSGGEPALARGFPALVQGLTRHKLAVFTNLSLVPDWYLHDRCLLFIATYHEECIDQERYVDNAVGLARQGKRVVAKLIVKPEPGSLEAQLPLWEKLWSHGVAAHFVPLEFDYYFGRQVVEDIRKHFLTSCLYNARFFRPASKAIDARPCAGGTARMFEIRSDGSFARCSSVHDMPPESSIFSPLLFGKPRGCTRNDCFCEWHHWANMARAHENARWTFYLTDNIWQRPCAEEFDDFIDRMYWDRGGRISHDETVSGA